MARMMSCFRKKQPILSKRAYARIGLMQVCIYYLQL